LRDETQYNPTLAGFNPTGKQPYLRFPQTSKFDELVKSLKTPFFVIPAKAGIQFFQLVTEFLGSGFHRSDDFLRNHQI
jgi:hypothetical protein